MSKYKVGDSVRMLNSLSRNAWYSKEIYYITRIIPIDSYYYRIDYLNSNEEGMTSSDYELLKIENENSSMVIHESKLFKDIEAGRDLKLKSIGI